MAYPLNDVLLIHDTDASDTQISGILSQIQGGQERIISYGSRTLNKALNNYCITDNELLTIRHFLEYYRQYLLGCKFPVRSDYQAFTYIFNLKEPKAYIACWIKILSAFDFSIAYRKDGKHGNADSLARCENPLDCQCSDVDILGPLMCGPCNKCQKRFKEMQGLDRLIADDLSGQPLKQDDCIRTVTTRSQAQGQTEKSLPGPTNEERPLNQWFPDQDLIRVQKVQYDDTDIAPILKALAKGERPSLSEIVALSPASRYYRSIWHSLSLKNGCMFHTFYRKDANRLSLIVYCV